MLINVNEDELEHAALDALTALARAFSSEDHFRSPVFIKVLQAILKGIYSILRFLKGLRILFIFLNCPNPHGKDYLCPFLGFLMAFRNPCDIILDNPF